MQHTTKKIKCRTQREYLCSSFKRILHLAHILRLGVAGDLLVLCAVGIGVGAVVELSGHARHAGYAAGIGLRGCWCCVCDEGEDREDCEEVIKEVEAGHFVEDKGLIFELILWKRVNGKVEGHTCW